MIPAPQLYQQHLKRQQSRIATYNKVLQRIEKRIIHASNMDQFQIQYNIPEMMMGEPLYKPESCLLYLYMKMSRLGYEVTVQLPRTIAVTWNRYDDDNNNDDEEPTPPPPLPPTTHHVSKQVTFVTEEKNDGGKDRVGSSQKLPQRSCLAPPKLAPPPDLSGHHDLLSSMQNRRNAEIQSWSSQIPSSIWGRR